MCAFHSRAGVSAATCAVSNGASHSVKPWPQDTDVAAFSTARLEQVRDVRLRKLIELIDSDPLSRIQDWAVALNLSQSHLQHLFKEATGVGLGHVLTEKRLQRAAELLSNTNLSIKEIAGAVGYEHASSFTRAFEKRFVHGPRQYRYRSQEMLANSKAG
jgi:transcriptional regulator GlxA family with amidase domain